MNYLISNKEYAKNVFDKCLNQVKNGNMYNISFDEVKRGKTVKQLKFFWGAIVRSLEDYFKENGYFYPDEVIKEYLYCETGMEQTEYFPNGTEIVFKKRLSTMTKDEASEFIQRCISWVDENTTCILPIEIRYLWTSSITDDEIDKLLAYPFPERDDLYLKQTRKKQCIYCGKNAEHAHHIRTGFWGKSVKPPDYMAIPLCAEHHQLVHSIGEQNFLKGIKNVLNDMDISVFCRCLYQRTKLHL